MLSASLIVLVNLCFSDNLTALYSIKRTTGNKFAKNVKKSTADSQVRNAWNYAVRKVLNLPAAPAGGPDVPFLCRNCVFLCTQAKFLVVFVDVDTEAGFGIMDHQSISAEPVGPKDSEDK